MRLHGAGRHFAPFGFVHFCRPSPSGASDPASHWGSSLSCLCPGAIGRYSLGTASRRTVLRCVGLVQVSKHGARVAPSSLLFPLLPPVLPGWRGAPPRAFPPSGLATLPFGCNPSMVTGSVPMEPSGQLLVSRLGKRGPYYWSMPGFARKFFLISTLQVTGWHALCKSWRIRRNGEAERKS